MKSTSWVLAGCLLISFTAATAVAELPDEASVRYRVSRTTKNDRVSHRITPSINAVLGLDEFCTVTVRACIQNFVPVSLPLDPETRRCTYREIGSGTLSAGDSSLNIRTKSGRSKENRKRNGKQTSIQVQASCTDGTTTTVVTSLPKARKTSVNGIKGATIRRILNQMTSNFTS